MKIPNIPENEESRLQNLRDLDILDTSSDERFDRLTRMAKHMFDVPIALVSLVDENRQWFKSCIGLDVSETPRDISFCGHAILGSDVFIIPDTAKDERFADNPLVTDEPNIRFYAGCPIRLSDGSALGTLCIIDRKPRELTEEDIEALQDLAATAEREFAAIQLATQDELTNVANRRGFTMIANQSLNLCVRKKIPASLVYLDLDDFKLINDTFGHPEGDNALITFTNQIIKLCRESDIVARLGGDEFSILHINTTKNSAKNFIARLQHAFDAFSYGIIEFNAKKHNSIEKLLEDADSKMYDNKKKKKAHIAA